MSVEKIKQPIEREAWLEGALEGYAPLVMPAAHALVQAARDIAKAAPNMTLAQLNARPNGAPSLAFHLRHIRGSLDRLMTYARGEQLSEAQFAFLHAENAFDENQTAKILTAEAIEQIEKALQMLHETDVEMLFERRFVGREKLPTSVFGLFFHLAEHTQRHTGQIVTTARIVGEGQFDNYLPTKF